MELLRTRLRITDINESLDFFCDKLGLVEIGRGEVEAGGFTLISLATPEEAGRAQQDDAPLLELAWKSDPEFGSSRGVGHIAYQVEDLYWLCHYLRRNGVTISRPPRDGRMACVRSPDGHIIELRQQGNPREPEEPWLSMQDAELEVVNQLVPEESAMR